MNHVNQASASISATTTSSRTAYPADANKNGVRALNAGTVAAFIKSGDSTVDATTSGQFLAPGEAVTFVRDPKDTHLAGITPSGNATIYFTPCSAIAD